MTEPTTPEAAGHEPIAGDPLMSDPDVGAVTASTTTPPPVAPEPVARETVAPETAKLEPPTVAPTREDDDGGGGGKVKAAAVVAGAAALANKVRQEAPKVMNQLRERRMAGRCVIVTEVDGRFLAIGPYKNEDSARSDVFKVGGSAHVAELVSDAAFFAPPEQP